MSLLYSVQIAFDNLRANKLRSGLTMLGIIIGVSAVIMMVAILQGASARITNEFSKLGSNLIIVAYSPTQEERQKLTRRIPGLKMDDVRAIQQKCDLIKTVAPELGLGRGATVKFAGKSTDAQATGVIAAYAGLRNVRVATGRFLTDDDEQSWAKVCVIGSKIVTELFPGQTGEAVLGKTLELNGTPLTIVGVLTSKGRTFEGDADKAVYLPLTTVQKRFVGEERVDDIYAEPVSLEKINDAKDQVWQLLMGRYHNLPGWKVDSFDNMLASINNVLTIFTIVLGAIAGLALLVGGIGIMNIMLVSVTERTREIGVRKAIGAKRRDILTQFIIESATVSGVGGLLGAAIGTSVSYLLGWLTTFIPALVDAQSGTKGIGIYVPPWAIIGSFAFSAAVGLFFGIYPAVRASRLDPIQALRHE